MRHDYLSTAMGRIDSNMIKMQLDYSLAFALIYDIYAIMSHNISRYMIDKPIHTMYTLITT